jgi:subtilisin family serine protease
VILKIGSARNARLLLLLLFAGLNGLKAQTPKQYTLWLKDKAGSTYSISKPLEFLSRHSLDRRAKQGFSLDETDLPVSPQYLQVLRHDSLRILFTSRWLNTVTVETTDSLFPDKISNYPFVKGLHRVRFVGKTQDFQQAAENLLDPGSIAYGSAFYQIYIHNGQFLHKKGYQGQGMQIAVIDAGFFRVDSLYAFDYMRKRGGILRTWDFEERNDSVYEDDVHGMEVLSIIGGRLDGKLVGTAPEADFYLLRTEIAQTEYPVEEFAWISALEWADSAGADVINSSLGYSTFNDSTLNHERYQLDGKTIPISRAAGMAASKGMIVVNSAGNSGNSAWHYISFPADADNILAVGAVDDKNRPASFSSYGPSSDARVKPDVSARGYQSFVASTKDSQITTVNGTSSAAPVITGLVTCLWQEFPNKTSYQVMDAVRKSSSLYLNPDDQMGYGIPDFLLAEEILKEPGMENRLISAFPNPFKTGFTTRFYSAEEGEVNLYLTDALGRIVWQEKRFTPSNYINEVKIESQQILPQGLYILSIYAPGKVLTAKLIRY